MVGLLQALEPMRGARDRWRTCGSIAIAKPNGSRLIGTRERLLEELTPFRTSPA